MRRDLWRNVMFVDFLVLPESDKRAPSSVGNFCRKQLSSTWLKDYRGSKRAYPALKFGKSDDAGKN